MSRFYKESNKESSANLFNKRSAYYSKNLTSSGQYENLTDFFAEKLMYGKVSKFFVPIVLPKDSTNLKTIPTKSNTPQNLRALNFVVDAFVDLQKHFQKSVANNKIKSDDPYLSNLQVYKAYVDPYDHYQAHLIRLAKNMKTSNYIDSPNLKNINMMNEGLARYMEVGGLTNPMTFPAYVKSKASPMNISGLVIEIADLDTRNDDEKINLFTNSPNWNYYLNICRSFGFMVDLDVPWRLVADIGSEQMLEYARNYDFNTSSEILTFCYQSAHYKYSQNFTQNLLDIYDFFKPKYIINKEECKGSTRIIRLKPNNYSNIESVYKEYNKEKILNLYCNIRFSEEETRYSDNQKNNILINITDIYRKKGFNTAISEFESFINLPFDYQGSLGYYVQRKREREEQDRQQMIRTARY